jgi:hypothetical protein
LQDYLFLHLINPVVLQRFFCITCPGFSGRDPLLSGFAAEKEKNFHSIYSLNINIKNVQKPKHMARTYKTEKKTAEHK